MAEQLYTRAVWIEGGKDIVDCTIPKTWVVNKSVRWPPVQNATQAIRTQRKPGKDWRSYELLKEKHTGHYARLFLSL
jgi:hypothetical protein